MNWQHLLTECNSQSSVGRYCRYLFLTEIAQKNRAYKLATRTKEIKLPSERKCPYHGPNRGELKYGLGLRSYLHGQPFVIDLDYDCNDREERSTRSQLEDCYGLNTDHPEGFQLHFTSVNKHKQLYLQYKAGMLDSSLCYYHEKPFWELFPRERLVYLCPDAPMLKYCDGNDIYVMGGLVDIDISVKRSSFAKAKQLGIRTGSFPISEFGV